MEKIENYVYLYEYKEDLCILFFIVVHTQKYQIISIIKFTVMELECNASTLYQIHICCYFQV